MSAHFTSAVILFCVLFNVIRCTIQDDDKQIGVQDYSIRSCKEIKARNPAAPSGIYRILGLGYSIEVYCEMGLNGGGYTFLNPKSLAEISGARLQSLITDRKSVLMRIRRCDGTQPYSVLEQLPQYSTLSLHYGLNNFTGYQGPLNQAGLGGPYLFVGFLPRTTAAARTVQGIRANGRSHTFTNCDANGNSQIVLFPNFSERPPSSYALTTDYPFCNNIFNGALPNPSSRVMPPEYFMFTEFHFGGCGCYSQTDSRLSKKCILGFQVGFR